MTGTIFQLVIKAETGEQSSGSLFTLGAGPARVNRWHLHITKGRKIPQQMIPLENETKMLPPKFGELVRFKLRRLSPANPVDAGCGPVETAKDIHQSGFPRSGRTDDSDHFARMDIQINVFQRHENAVTGWILAAYLSEFQQRFVLHRDPHRNILVGLNDPLRPVMAAAVAELTITLSPSSSPSRISAWTLLLIPTATDFTATVSLSCKTCTE